MRRPKITEHVRYTKATALRNVQMLKALKYMEAYGSAASEDLVQLLDISSASGRKYVADFLDLGLIEFSHTERRTHIGVGIKVYVLKEGAYEKALKMLPTEWDGQCVSNHTISRPQGQHLMADDHRAPQRLTTVRVHRDPLVTFLCGEGRAPSLNFIDSATGG